MTLAQRIKSIFNYGAVAPPDPRRSMFIPLTLDANGRFFGSQEALQLSVVWACVSVISRSLAGCAWKVYERKDGKLTYLEDDALDYLLNTRPNPEMTAISMKEALVSSAAVWGNGYAEIVRDQAGRVKELWPLNPDRTEPIRVDANGAVATTGELAYRCFQPNTGATVILRQSAIYHLRGPSLTGLLGESMVFRAAKSLALTAAADQFATAYYRNNTVVGGVLEHPKTMDRVSFERLKADWAEKHSGPDNAHKPVILENGMTWKAMGDSSAATSQMLESRRFQVEELARWFAVPLHMLGSLAGSQGYGTNLEQLGLGFVRDCLGPWAERMQQEADWKFFPLRGPTSKKQTRIDLSPLTRGDSLTRANAYAVMRRIGVYSANDILRMEGQNCIGPEGDVRLIEASMISYDELDSREDVAEAATETAMDPPDPVPAQLGGAPADGEDPNADPEGESVQEDGPPESMDPAALASAITQGVMGGAQALVTATLEATRPVEMELTRDSAGRPAGFKPKEG